MANVKAKEINPCKWRSKEKCKDVKMIKCLKVSRLVPEDKCCESCKGYKLIK